MNTFVKVTESYEALIRIFDIFLAEVQTPIHIRVVNFFNRWISYHYDHFASNPELQDRLREFIEGMTPIINLHESDPRVIHVGIFPA